MAIKMADSIEELPDDYLECRGFAHNFERVSGDTVTFGRGNVVKEWIRHEQCPRCTSVRNMKIDGRTGQTITSHINYAPGYLLAQQRGRRVNRKRQARLEQIGRITVSKTRRKRSA